MTQRPVDIRGEVPHPRVVVRVDEFLSVALPVVQVLTANVMDLKRVLVVVDVDDGNVAAQVK